MATPKKQNDFDPNELIATSAEHEKTLGELHESITGLEKRVGTNAALAASFKDAFDNDKVMDKTLVDLIIHLIKTDETVRSAIKVAVEKIDKDWWNGSIKKVLVGVGFLLSAIVGAVLQALFSKMIQ